MVGKRSGHNCVHGRGCHGCQSGRFSQDTVARLTIRLSSRPTQSPSTVYTHFTERETRRPEGDEHWVAMVKVCGLRSENKIRRQPSREVLNLSGCDLRLCGIRSAYTTRHSTAISVPLRPATTRSTSHLFGTNVRIDELRILCQLTRAAGAIKPMEAFRLLVIPMVL